MFSFRNKNKVGGEGLSCPSGDSLSTDHISSKGVEPFKDQAFGGASSSVESLLLNKIQRSIECFLASNRDAFVGLFSRPKGPNLYQEGVSLVETIWNPRLEGKTYLREESNFNFVKLVFQRIKDMPLNVRLAGICLATSIEAHLRPEIESSLVKLSLFMSWKADGRISENHSIIPVSSERAETLGVYPSPNSITIQTERDNNRKAFKGFVGADGDIYSIIETPSDALLGYNDVTRDNLEWEKLHISWKNSFNRECLNMSFQYPTAPWLQGVKQAHLYTSLVRARSIENVNFESAAQYEAQLPLPPIEKTSTVAFRRAAELNKNNALANVGLIARNGIWWACPAWVGPIPLPSEIGLGDQNVEFLRVLLDRSLMLQGKKSYPAGVSGLDPNLDRSRWRTRQTMFYKAFETLRIPGEFKAGLPACLFQVFLRGDNGNTNFTVEPLKEIECPQPAGVWKGTVDERRSEDNHNNLKIDNYTKYLNRYGEGAVWIEHTSPPLVDGEMSLESQRLVFLHKVVNFHNRNPQFEVLESQYSENEAEILPGAPKSKHRRLFMRVKDHNWKDLTELAHRLDHSKIESEKAEIASEIRSELTRRANIYGGVYKNAQNLSESEGCLEAEWNRKKQLSLVQPGTKLWRDTIAALKRNIQAWEGCEDEHGRGCAFIEMIDPSPVEGNPGTGACNHEAVKLFVGWSEQFWWRKIKCVQFVKRWDAHNADLLGVAGFNHGFLICFERRTKMLDGKGEIGIEIEDLAREVEVSRTRSPFKEMYEGNK